MTVREQVIDKSKLVYAVGWFNAQHNLQNISKADHVIGSSPSFCQAASLAQHPGVVKHMDASGTWVFDRTDPAGAGFRVWYDDEASLGPKYAMVREAGWGGVGMWLANGARRRLPAQRGFRLWPAFSPDGFVVAAGMFPGGLHITKPGVFDWYCPEALHRMWASIATHFVGG